MTTQTGPRFDVAHACAHLRVQLATDDPIVVELSRSGEQLAEFIAAHVTTVSDKALAGHALTLAAGGLACLVEELRQADDVARVVVNVLGFAGLHLIDQAQAATS